MPVDFGPGPIEAKQGDVFPAVAVLVEIRDADGDPVTDGEPTLRVGTLVSGPYDEPGTHLLDADLNHVGEGIWRWEPEAGQLAVGRWRMEVHPGDGAVPHDGYGTLLVRPTIPEEPS